MNFNRISKLLSSDVISDNLIGIELVKSLDEEILIKFFTKYGFGKDYETNPLVFEGIALGSGDIEINDDETKTILYKIGQYYLYIGHGDIYLDDEKTFKNFEYNNPEIIILR